MKGSLDSGIDLSGQQDSKQENHAEMNVSNPEPEILLMTNQPTSDADNNQLLVRTILVLKTLRRVCV